MENRAHALITGVFLIGILAAILVGAQWLGGERKVRLPYRVVATQPVSGLNPQAQVRYRGMPAGRVTTIGLDPKDKRRILIGIEVDEDVPVTKGTYAQLGMEGITGVAYVHLLDEGKDSTALPKDAELAMQPSFMDTLSDSAEGISRETKVLVASLNKLLNPENQERIGRTLASLERTAAHLDATTQKLPATIDRADARLAAWLAEDNRKQMSETLRNMNQATAALPELAREAQQLVKETRTLVGQIQALSAEANGTASSLREGTLPQVNALAESVERGAQKIGRLAGELNRKPESLLFGNGGTRPGPGEPGFQ